MVSVFLAGFDRHADAAVGLQRALERLVCLESHDLFFIFIQISGAV